MTKLKTVIVTLTGANYCTWKLQCKVSLMCDELWGVFSGTETSPEAETEHHAKFITCQDRALVAIILSIYPTLLYLLGIQLILLLSGTNCHCNFREKCGLALRRQLHSLKLKEGQSIQEHVKNLMEIFNKLAIIGDNISDEDKVVYLLASPPESFGELITALEANSTVPAMEIIIE